MAPSDASPRETAGFAPAEPALGQAPTNRLR
jgi:hypothetical protein